MKLLERVKKILLTPKTEWEVINSETATPVSLLTSYVLPLACVSILGSILTGVFNSDILPFSYYLKIALISLVSSLITFYIASLIFDQLATSFSSEKDINKSSQLVAYSLTPSYVAGFFSFIPILGLLLLIAAVVYAIYLMYLGLGPLKKTSDDKKVVYLIVSFVIIFVIQMVIAGIFTAVLLGSSISSSMSM